MKQTRPTSTEQARKDAMLLQTLGQEIDRWPASMKAHAAKGKRNLSAACKSTPQAPHSNG